MGLCLVVSKILYYYYLKKEAYNLYSIFSYMLSLRNQGVFLTRLVGPQIEGYDKNRIGTLEAFSQAAAGQGKFAVCRLATANLDWEIRLMADGLIVLRYMLWGWGALFFGQGAFFLVSDENCVCVIPR